MSETRQELLDRMAKSIDGCLNLSEANERVSEWYIRGLIGINDAANLMAGWRKERDVRREHGRKILTEALGS